MMNFFISFVKFLAFLVQIISSDFVLIDNRIRQFKIMKWTLTMFSFVLRGGDLLQMRLYFI